MTAELHRISPALRAALSNRTFLASLRFQPVASVPELNPGTKLPRGAAAALLVSFQMGLTTGFGYRRKWSFEEASEYIKRLFPEGGTAVFQKGWYKGTFEDSMRVTIENTGLPEKKFKKKMEDMLSHLTDHFRQNEIYFDYYEGSKIVGSFAIKHKD